MYFRHKLIGTFLGIVRFYTYLCHMKNYFTIQELVVSDTAKRFGIDNTPTPQIKMRLQELITSLLNPIREAWGGPVIVTSGYRCPELNKKVNGAATSVHMIGYAADLIPGNGKRAKFVKFVQNYLKTHNLPFDQCIDEYGRWCHVGLKNNAGQQRKQIFRIG